MKIFAKRLKELRKEKNITQDELSKKIGYGQSIISKWENNEFSPTAEAIVAIADYFDISTDYLLGRTDY